MRCWRVLAFDLQFAEMNPQIRIELLKLANGQRLLRLEHPGSGLCLEKRLDEALPVLAQKQRWQRVFEGLVERELATA